MFHAAGRFAAILGCGLIVSQVLLPAAAVAQPPDAPSQFTESVTLETDSSVAKRLKTVTDYIAEKQWTEAIEIIQQIAAAHGESLISIEEHRYVDVATYCNLLLANLPDEALTVYRQRRDPQARRWYEQAKQTRDEELLRKLIRNAFVSSYGDEALFLLGEMVWDRGEMAAARHYWQQMLPVPAGVEITPGTPLPVLRYPDADIDPAAIRARLILCSLFSGEFERARAELTVFRRLHPDASGSLAGREGNLAEIIASVIEAAEDWNYPDPDDDAPTFALNMQRNKVMPQAVDVGAIQWSRPLIENLYLTPATRPALKDQGPLSSFPVVVDDLVLANDSDRIYAWNLLTGQPAWESGRKDDDGRVYPPLGQVTGLPGRPVVGVPRYTLTVHENRLYARMGTPVTGRARHELRDLVNEIVCLDLQRQGDLLWKISGQEIGPGWAFEGSPVVAAGRAYAAIRRSDPQTQSAVVCLDAQTGKLLWQRNVCAAVSGVGDSRNFMSHLLLTLSETSLFLSTDLGAIACLDRNTGNLQWVTTYRSDPPGKPADVSDHLRQGLTPCLLDGDHLIAAPNDSPKIFALDPVNGRRRWERKLPGGVRHLLGVLKGSLIVSGDSLWALDPATGAVQARLGFADPASHGYGRGVLAGDVVYWPTREEIFVARPEPRARSFEIERRVQLRNLHGESPGNLVVSGGFLLVAQPRKVVAFCEYSRLKKRLRQEISLNPGDVSLLWHLARAEEAAGDVQAALRLLRQIESQPETSRSVEVRQLRSQARARRFALLLEAAEFATERTLHQQAITDYREALQIAPSRVQRLQVLLAIGESHRARGDPSEAIAAWQQILLDPELAVLRIGEETPQPAALLVRDRIQTLIDRHGRDVYADFDRRAEVELNAALQDARASTVRRVIARYPNARSTPGALLALASSHRQRNEPHDAIATLRLVLAHPAPPSIHQNALIELAETFESLKYWRPAAATWQKLAERFGDSTREQDGQEQTVSALVASRLSRPEFADSAGNDAPPPTPWKRTWQRDISSRERLIIPHDDPPAAHLRSLLIEDAGALRCLSPVDGRERWRGDAEEPLRWSACGDIYLLLATDHAVRAVTLEDGATRWERRFAYPDDDSSRSRNRGADDAAGSADEPTVTFALQEELLLCRIGNRRVLAVSARSGELAWEFRPAVGRLRPGWFVDTAHVLLQVDQPYRTITLETGTGRQTAEFDGAGTPWAAPPVRLSDDHFGFVTSRREILGISVAKNGVVWTYRGPMSFANADPVLHRAAEGPLLLVIDGDTLVRLNRETGKIFWSRPLTARFQPGLADGLLSGADSAWIVDRGVLRAFSLSNGALRWETPLGRHTGLWQLARSGDSVIAWPTPAERGETTRLPLVICQATTGQLIQRMWFTQQSPPAPAGSDLQFFLPAAIARHGKSLTALGAFR